MTIEDWEAERERLTGVVLDNAGMVTKRFFSLDNQTYRDGALDARTKELLGLVASAVLRCDDCITYHIKRCHDLGYTTAEVDEAMSVALVVGGSIVIPHMRRAMDRWRELRGPCRAGGRRMSENKERLGEFLVRIGVMTPDQVETVLATQADEPDKMFGELAIEMGFIDDDAVTAYLESKK